MRSFVFVHQPSTVGSILLTVSAIFAANQCSLAIATQATDPSSTAKTPGPKVGETAVKFSLKALDGEQVELARLTKAGPVVIVVLRGYAGYQCPICNAQVGEFLGQATKFKAADASLVFVYPGPADGLEGKAKEFIRGKTLPENVFLAVDPDYEFTDAYGLRWDAPRETAYPATYVVDEKRKSQFAKVSTTHGGRAKAADVVSAVTNIKKSDD